MDPLLKITFLSLILLGLQAGTIRFSIVFFCLISCRNELLNVSFLRRILYTYTIDAYSFIPKSRSLVVPQSSSQLQMKLYDWKRRTADESAINDLDNFVFTLDNLKPAPGSRERKSRKGRGISAGQGATCGFGMRGQKSRSGNPTRPGFEGGQTPLYRRLPKFVGKPTGPGHEKTIYNIISTDSLKKAQSGTTLNFDSLLQSKLVTKSKYNIHKVVSGSSDGEFPTNLTVQAHAFTKSARASIEAAGGKCELLSKTTNKVLEEATA